MVSGGKSFSFPQFIYNFPTFLLLTFRLFFSIAKLPNSSFSSVCVSVCMMFGNSTKFVFSDDRSGDEKHELVPAMNAFTFRAMLTIERLLLFRELSELLQSFS